MLYVIMMISAATCDNDSSTSPKNDRIDIDMVTIPAGSFLMGSNGENDPDNPDKGSLEFRNEQPVHIVKLNSFMLSVTEITQEQYTKVIGENPSYYTGDDFPVEQVSWKDTAIFCNRLSKTNGYKSCYNEETYECDFSKNGYRLPTEAEWEYACRAGTTTENYTGNDAEEMNR